MCGVVGAQLRQPLAQQAPYAAADDAVRDEALFGPIDRLLGCVTHGTSMGNYVAKRQTDALNRGMNVGTEDFRMRRHDPVALAQRRRDHPRTPER